MGFKTVKYTIPAFDVNMGGIMIKQALPTEKVEQHDPFLLLHHADFKFNKNSSAMHQGVGPHPHRGFSPVTFVIEGEIHHRDSRGNSQVAKAGEVQWMHAGAGVIHSERPSQDLVDQEGTQEIIQLWINSPAEHKMAIPSYQYKTEENINSFYSQDQLVKNKLISGNYQNHSGAFNAMSELILIWAEAKATGQSSYTIDPDLNSMLYLIKGTIKLKGHGMVEAKDLIIFNNDAENIQIEAENDAQFLLLSGKPINEKLVQHGPFVMNSQTEILDAMRDYQMGKMGLLIEEA